jgi:antitoxin (DNA-binding transcriptional repressor) of toxin-antitoxin stability system
VTVGADACRIAFGYWMDRVAAGEDTVVTRRGRPMIRLSAAVPPLPQRIVAPAPPVLFPPSATAAGSP